MSEERKAVGLVPWLEQLDTEIGAVNSLEQTIKLAVGPEVWDQYVQHRNAVSSFVRLISHELKKIENSLEEQKKAAPGPGFSKSAAVFVNSVVSPAAGAKAAVTRTDVFNEIERVSLPRRGSSVDMYQTFGPPVIRENNGKRVYRKHVMNWFYENRGKNVTVEDFVSYWNQKANNNLQMPFVLGLWSAYTRYLSRNDMIGDIKSKNRFVTSIKVKDTIPGF